jgi:hemerythrin-like domain-containing protein
MNATRRSFLSATAAGAFAISCHHGESVDEVTPTEDLMREHGVLRRVMYLYDETIARLAGRRDLPLDALAACAAMIRRVIEDYHEKLEEQQLFPRFENAGKLVGLVATLRRQHQVGRSLTDEISTLAKASLDDSDRDALASALHRFNHMYRAHAAREDTVLFPALRGLVGAAAYRELGDAFEDQEARMLGERGFEHAVADVARLEQAFGVADLAELTPSV